MHLQSGASGLDGWVWDGSLGGLRHRAPYGATLITTFSAIFIDNIIFEIIGPFCDMNFIYTYPGPARVISDIQNQSYLFLLTKVDISKLFQWRRRGG